MLNMAEKLLFRVAVGEISGDQLKNWLITNSKEHFLECGSINCTKLEFLTYFLNFLHEEIPRQIKYCESPLKECAARQTKLSQTDDSIIKKMDHSSELSTPKLPMLPSPVNRSLERSLGEVSTNTTNNSTPKVQKINSDFNVDSAHASPISPLYKTNCSFSTPKSKPILDKLSPLCLGDFIVHRKSSNKKRHTKSTVNQAESIKRITPTCLSKLSVDCDLRLNSNSFNNFNTSELSSQCVSEARNILAEERLKILIKNDSAEHQVFGTSKIGSSLYQKINVDPHLSKVTCKNEIDNIAEIYLIILQNSLVLNITSEIYFLISLLSIKQYVYTLNTDFDHTLMGVEPLDEEQSELTNDRLGTCNYFESIHNIIYFAVKCLESQFDVLKYYDKSTLKILSSNKRLKNFSGTLSIKLEKMSDKKSERVVDIKENDSQFNVCFNLDTDNRDNFPNDVTFHAFRKQRDLFYEILRIWETNHLQSGWNFALGLTGKIKALLQLQNEPVNFMHFARLFKDQLMSTNGRLQKEVDLSVEQMPFLSSLPNVDANKLSRLKNRLITKQPSAGLNSPPLFTGYQEFYKNFIIVAANHTFNTHLANTIILEIVELNNSNFFSSDLEDSDENIDSATRESYLKCIMHLRLLAKFLGFIHSLPYKSENYPYSDTLLVTQIASRQETTPNFDVKKLLINSFRENTVVLSVPWITKYLSMLDYVSLRLPYYMSVHKILFQIYRVTEKSSKNGFDYNSSLVKFCLGWLFELPHFPDNAYFTFCLNEVVPKSKIIKKLALDDLDIVDQNILYRCCPYLEEIKKLLASNITNNHVTVKHITPVTSVRSSIEITKRKLELQLEEAFFNGQPVSVRKTVEFVSERIASTCIKHICNNVVPEFKLKAKEELQGILESWKTNCNMFSPLKEKSQKCSSPSNSELSTEIHFVSKISSREKDQSSQNSKSSTNIFSQDTPVVVDSVAKGISNLEDEVALRMDVNQLAKTSLSLLRDECGVVASDIMKTKIPPSIEGLLAIDCLKQTKTVCISLASKMCKDRVKQWITTHVTMTIFSKDFDNEVQKIYNQETRKNTKDRAVFALPPGGKDKNHDDSCLSAFHILERIKLFSVDIIERSEAVNREATQSLLQATLGTLARRCDVNENITSYICTSLVDLALLLIIHRPDIMPDEDLMRLCIEVWKYYFGEVEDLFKNLLCPRNVMMLAQSCNDTVVWKNFAVFVAFLTKENVITISHVESQCTGFYKKEWDQIVLQNFSLFLKSLVEQHKANGGDVDRFTLLMEFLSDYCIDL